MKLESVSDVSRLCLLEVARPALRVVRRERFFPAALGARISGRARNSAPGLPRRGSRYPTE